MRVLQMKKTMMGKLSLMSLRVALLWLNGGSKNPPPQKKLYFLIFLIFYELVDNQWFLNLGPTETVFVQSRVRPLDVTPSPVGQTPVGGGSL